MSQPALRPFDLSALSAVKVRYQTIGGSVRSPDALVIVFDGVFGFGSGGNDDGRFMYAMAAAGILATDPSAVIFDFSELDYQWGDMLDLVYMAADVEAEEQGRPFAVVVGPRSREAVTSLAQQNYDFSLNLDWMHDDVGSAWAHLKRLAERGD